MTNKERIQRLKELKYLIYSKEHQIDALEIEIKNLIDEFNYLEKDKKKLIKRKPRR